MAIRTTEQAVQDILLGDYDTVDEPSLTPFMEAASSVVTRVNVCAGAKSITISTADLELIERWLSAHFYVMSDQPYSESSTLRSKVKFQGRTGMYLEASKYGQMAVTLDYSGCLSAISKRQTVRISWLGKLDSEKETYDDRNG